MIFNKSLLKNTVPYKHPTGDLICERPKILCDYIQPVTLSKFEERYKYKYVIPLTLLNFSSPYKALNILMEDDIAAKKVFIASGYEDIYTSGTGRILMPISILTDKPKPYMDQLIYDDEVKELRTLLAEKNNAHIALSRMQDVLMGSGYTYGTLPYDGSLYKEHVTLTMDNNDIILCALFVWFNI